MDALGLGWTGTLAGIAIKSVLLAAVALLALRLFRYRSAAERASIAHIALALMLALPILAVAAPRLPVPVPGLHTPVPPEPSAQVSPLSSSQAQPSLPRAPRIPSSAPLQIRDLALLLYCIPAGLMLGLTLVGIFRLGRLRTRSDVVVEEAWLKALAMAQRRMGFHHGAALLVSDELTAPISWGILRPVILLSEQATREPADAEAIIAHELAHVARLDWLHLLVARLAIALFWFNPLVWALARQAHHLSEEAADDSVLNAGVPSAEYADLLVCCARHEKRGLLLAANGVAPSRSSLGIRVGRILDPELRRGPARLAWTGGGLLAMAALAAPLAALTPVGPAETTSRVVASTAPRLAPPAAVATIVAASSPEPRVAAAAGTPVVAADQVAPPGAPPAPSPMPAARPSATDLIELRAHGVDEQRLREWAAVGYSDLSHAEMIEFADNGVTSDYIRGWAAAGYAGLPPGRLVEFKKRGVTAEFAREAARSTGQRPTPARLVEMRDHAGDPPPEAASSDDD